MIVFVPAYDEATRANLSIAQAIVGHSPHLLLHEDALAERLKTTLQSKPAPLFAMSHGVEEHFFDQNDTPALSLKEVHLLSNLPVFVFACFTANAFGKAAARQNALYWGYTGRIQTPDPQPLVARHFQTVFKIITDGFPHLRSESDIASFLVSLQGTCEHANDQLDKLWDSDPNVDLLEAYHCLLHIWSRLRVHHPDLTEPMRHPEAPISDLFA